MNQISMNQTSYESNISIMNRLKYNSDYLIKVISDSCDKLHSVSQYPDQIKKTDIHKCLKTVDHILSQIKKGWNVQNYNIFDTTIHINNKNYCLFVSSHARTTIYENVKHSTAFCTDILNIIVSYVPKYEDYERYVVKCGHTWCDFSFLHPYNRIAECYKCALSKKEYSRLYK